ncbi:hypothetical protein [Streptomyces violascens]|uniref:hypothetical protein n=1 Tax=Streptomyces violascens TaxID=67381 RepID=UPI0036629F33
MANSSADRTAKTQTTTPTWHDLAQVSDRKRQLWRTGGNHTDWMACGIAWDAVAITPMATGLAALGSTRTGTRCGYLVLADHLRNVLYVLVPPGTGGACDGILGVRVLSHGYQLLVPTPPEHSNIVADWVSHPPGDKPPRLVQAEQLAAHLRDLTPPMHDKEVAS